MKFRFGAYACMMIGLAAVMTACGGGGGGGGGVTIPVTSSKNPQLIGQSVTITADFTNYTSTARFGTAAAKPGTSLANFAVSPAATLSATTATIQADNMATVDLTALTANTYTVTASFNAASGSKGVTFIPQPGSATVLVKSPALTGLGYIQCSVTHDLPVIFSNFSTMRPAGSLTETNPPTTLGSIPGPEIASIVAGSAFNIAANATLFKLSYNMSGAGVPNFAINNDLAMTYYLLFTDPSTLLSPALTIQETYFAGPDGTGTKLYQSP
jgi:hypothetical protein